MPLSGNVDSTNDKFGPTERARVIFSHVNEDSRFAIESSFSTSSTTNGNNEKPKKKPGNWLDALQMDPKLYWPKKYRYTAEPRPGSHYMLTVKERDFYEDNGFLIVKNLVPQSVVNSVVANLKDKTKLTQTLNAAKSNNTLKDLINSPQIVKYVEAFCGYDIMTMTCSPVFDSIYSTQTSNIHRDLHSLPFRPADRIVTLWIAMEDCNEVDEPGLIVLPGSHRSGYLETIYSDDAGNKIAMYYERIPEMKRMEEMSNGKRYLNLKPGDALFYHPLLAYNIQLRPQGRLVAITCRFADSKCDYVETTNNHAINYQSEAPPYLSNVTAGQGINKDFWKDEALILKGKRINL